MLSEGLRYLFNKNRGDASKLSIPKGFGILNISGIIKYIPGKVWSYLILFYVMKSKGFSLAKTVMDSFVHLVLYVTTPFLFMIPVSVFFFLSSLTTTIKILLIISGLLIYFVCLIISPLLLKVLVTLVNRFKKKEPIEYTPVSRSSVIKTQLFILAAYIFYITSAGIIIYSIDSSLHISEILQISVLCVFAAIVGFLALIVPGGLGVQETMIFLFMSSQSKDISLSIVLPVIFRMVGFITDLLVGLTAFWLIRKEAIAAIKKPSQT